MTFASTKVEPVDASHFKLIGNLTLHGVTRPVTLDVEMGGIIKDPWGKQRAAFTATTVLNRKDFGLSYSKVLETGGLMVGDEVKVEIQVEGVKSS